MKIAIVGAGVAGALLAHRLSKVPGVELLCLERVAPDDHSEAGTGLNVGPNAIKALRLLDPALAAQVEAASLPWQRWTTQLADGTPLFDLPLHEVADNPGIRIRWSELYRVLREAAGTSVRYGCTDIEVARDAQDAQRTTVSWVQNGQACCEAGIDLLIGCDGRYSQVRRTFSGTPEPKHIGVAIQRALVEDTSGGLIDDYGQWFNGPHRMLAFKVKPHHVYIAVTFPLEPGEPVNPAWNTEAAMRATWQPTSGQPLTPAMQWMLDALCQNLDASHWARMQESPISYGASDCGVMYVGDAAHGMVPTLGQGATQAMEDACAAACLLEQALGAGSCDVRSWIDTLGAVRRERLRFAMDFSLEATDTLLAGAEPVAGAAWKTQPPFLDKLSRLFKDVALGETFLTTTPAQKEAA